jgi:hypothetical protein
MPWYKVFADHGPGHQSHTEFYTFERETLKEDSREALWQDHFDTGRYEWPIGGVKLVKKLPEQIRVSKLASYESKLKHDRFMLQVLGGQDPSTLRRRELSRILREWQEHCARMGKILKCLGCTDTVEEKAKEVMAELRKLRGEVATPPSKRKRYLHFAVISKHEGIGQYGCVWGTSLEDVKKNLDPREHGDLVRMPQKKCKACKEEGR